MRKVVFMIDGWFMRKRIYALKTFFYDGKNIREYCKKHLRDGDEIYRIYYYDTEPLDKKGHHPITKMHIDFSKTPVAIQQNELLKSIKCTPNFALRLGKTVWRGNSWTIKSEKLKKLINREISVEELSEYDVSPVIEQKTVDMKIGLDLAIIASKKLADVLIMITGDSDIIPVLKYARREGMIVGLDPLNNPIQPDLSEHVDFISTQISKYSVRRSGQKDGSCR